MRAYPLVRDGLGFEPHPRHGLPGSLVGYLAFTDTVFAVRMILGRTRDGLPARRFDVSKLGRVLREVFGRGLSQTFGVATGLFPCSPIR